MKSNISPISKGLLIVAALLLIISLFVPIWTIYLDAPQYPEGLVLKIWANKIAGDVDIINGLNHYIGMKTLHSDDFFEFKILPYLIGFFAVIFILAAFSARKKWLYIVFGAFVLFGVVAMVDFWKWEYDYGHNLNPDAAIKVPGMAYQPPLIGFKQLLNFGAYSIPYIGGWLFLSSGILLMLATLIETKVLKRNRPNKLSGIIVVFISTTLLSCSGNGPVPIHINKDACDFCKMSISDLRFASEIITQKGRVFKFDDIHCMLGYMATQKEDLKSYYVSAFNDESKLMDAVAAWYVQHESIRSPMGGHTASFASKDDAEKYAQQFQAEVKDWATLKSGINSKTADEHAH